MPSESSSVSARGSARLAGTRKRARQARRQEISRPLPKRRSTWQLHHGRFGSGLFCMLAFNAAQHVPGIAPCI
jgi:hypothetical protein